MLCIGSRWPCLVLTEVWLGVDDLCLQVGLALHVPLNQLVDGSDLAHS